MLASAHTGHRPEGELTSPTPPPWPHLTPHTALISPTRPDSLLRLTQRVDRRRSARARARTRCAPFCQRPPDLVALSVWVAVGEVSEVSAPQGVMVRPGNRLGLRYCEQVFSFRAHYQLIRGPRGPAAIRRRRGRDLRPAVEFKSRLSVSLIYRYRVSIQNSTLETQWASAQRHVSLFRRRRRPRRPRQRPTGRGQEKRR